MPLRILVAAALVSATAAHAAVPFTASARLASKADAWVLKELATAATVPVLVQMPSQADLSQAAAITDKTARGRHVYETLREHADATQADLRGWLATRGVQHQPFWVANMILVHADAATAEALAARTDVARLAANPTVKLSRPAPETPTEVRADAPLAVTAVEQGVTKIRATEMWAAGFTGQGIVIGGQDTGYRWTHSALKGKYRGWNGTTADHNYNWHDSIRTPILGGGGGTCGLNSIVPCDDDGHGTHTMGTMAGDDGVSNQTGVAPGARWIGCRNMDVGNGTPATYTECFQWFIAPTDLAGANPDPSKAPHVINNSWGCPPSEGCDDTALAAMKIVVENVQAAGILVVVSAGNDGSACSSVSDPAAIYEAAFSVGATNGGSSTDAIASFSSRGPVTVDGSGRMKPDIAAPGVNVRSSTRTSDASYTSLSGTSMAGPHVAGAAAVLMSAKPELIGNPNAIKRAFMRTAVRRPASTTTTICGSAAGAVPNNTYGWGRIDVKAAYDGAPGATLNVDKSTPTNLYHGATDGLLIARYLAGFTGVALTADALSLDATVTDPVALQSRLDSMRPAFDIDGDGQYRLGTDGVLVLRYLLGLRGTALTAGAVASGSARTSAADIEAYLQLLTP